MWTTRKLTVLDQRTLEARREREILNELIAHVGGKPSAPQKLLISRAARLAVTIELMERRMLESGEFGDLAGRQVIAWTNSLRMILALLGVERPEQLPARLADVIKVRAA
jgi:hypothetical protein